MVENTKGFREEGMSWYEGPTQGFQKRNGGGQDLTAPGDFMRRPEEENSPNRRQWDEQTGAYWRNKLV